VKAKQDSMTPKSVPVVALEQLGDDETLRSRIVAEFVHGQIILSISLASVQKMILIIANLGIMTRPQD
jgi:hypothetical protein